MPRHESADASGGIYSPPCWQAPGKPQGGAWLRRIRASVQVRWQARQHGPALPVPEQQRLSARAEAPGCSVNDCGRQVRAACNLFGCKALRRRIALLAQRSAPELRVRLCLLPEQHLVLLPPPRKPTHTYSNPTHHRRPRAEELLEDSARDAIELHTTRPPVPSH